MESVILEKIDPAYRVGKFTCALGIAKLVAQLKGVKPTTSDENGVRDCLQRMLAKNQITPSDVQNIEVPTRGRYNSIRKQKTIFYSPKAVQLVCAKKATVGYLRLFKTYFKNKRYAI